MVYLKVKAKIKLNNFSVLILRENKTTTLIAQKYLDTRQLKENKNL